MTRHVLPTPSERQLHLSVAEFFAVAFEKTGPNAVLAIHVPNEGRRTNREGALLKAMGLLPGIPDWCLLHQGQATWIELKTMRGRLSPEQMACHDMLRAVKCGVFLCRSLAEVELSLDQAGIPYRGSTVPHSPTYRDTRLKAGA